MRYVMFALLILTSPIWGLTLLAACSDPPVEGVVVHKQHSDAYDYVTMQCLVHDPKTFVCTAWMPITNHMPASWQVCVEGLDKNGKHAEGCIEIGEVEYAKYDEGSHYPRNGA